jgi:hypothetical protein
LHGTQTTDREFENYKRQKSSMHFASIQTSTFTMPGKNSSVTDVLFKMALVIFSATIHSICCTLIALTYALDLAFAGSLTNAERYFSIAVCNLVPGFFVFTRMLHRYIRFQETGNVVQACWKTVYVERCRD